MTIIIGLIPALPLLSFLIIALFGKLIPKRVVAIAGVGSVSLSAALTIFAGIRLLPSLTEGITRHIIHIYMD